MWFIKTKSWCTSLLLDSEVRQKKKKIVKLLAESAILFVFQEFGLIDKKELAPLQELIESIIVPYWTGFSISQ